MSKYMPGNWKWREVWDDAGRWRSALLLETDGPTPHNDPCILAAREDWIDYLRDTPQGQANAALIASAPEMLALLKELRAHRRNLPAELQTTLQAVITRAEGGNTTE
jgi:hypothetical protein